MDADAGIFSICFVLAVCLAGSAMAAEAGAEERSLAQEWVAEHFSPELPAAKAPAESPPGLVVIANNDPVQLNARGGRPMKIKDTEYNRGLYCHAVSKVQVCLPGPGKVFEAIAGVDSNEQTSGGRGSVIFSVRLGDREAFRSEVMREGMPGVPVSVDLEGAREFYLEISDTGDGISCDQSDWADARVTLADGGTVWLADLPIRETPERVVFSPAIPFSFTYGGRPSSEFLESWGLKRGAIRLDEHRTRYNQVYIDPKTHLEVRCEAVAYDDYPTVEWTVYFKNGGKKDTSILEDIQALDLRLDHTGKGEFTLHHAVGTLVAANDFEPLATTLKPDSTLEFTPGHGRPCANVFPYYNLEWPGQGLIAAVGWPGKWAARFERDAGGGLRIRAGQERTRFTLHPAEEVRTPLIVLQFWQGGRLHAQNVWRQWMLAHTLPKPYGKPLAAQMAACSSHQYGEMINANEENQKMFVDGYLKNGMKLDYWWMDAGWYRNETGWPNTGTWEVDPQRFPNGLRAITDYAHAKDVKSIVWFEPERVTPGTWLYENHPEWLLGRNGKQKLLNLGNPEARQWLIDHVDKLLSGQGIDLYRQDFNMDPLPYWRGNDAEDRQGITEIRHVEGYLAYWDALLERRPGMPIDTCASGGHRLDLETLRRSVPLLRSDYILEPIGQQGHTYGIAFWIPFFGTGVNSMDPYIFRSQMCPHITGCYDMRSTDTDFSPARKLYEQWRAIGPYYFGDFYPLTAYSITPDTWIAWQFHRPDLGAGMVQAFRRPECIYEAARCPLAGLDPEAAYTVTDLDAPESRQITGRELMESGLLIAISSRPGSALIEYKKVE